MAKNDRKIVGRWTWNSAVLWSKIIKTGADNCWAWLGAVGPQTNLFGARKDGVPQMTQARRILYRDITGEDCEELQISMRCKNAYCMNPSHFEKKPNLQKYYRDGTLHGTREVKDATAGLQRRRMKRMDTEWHLK